MKKYGWAAFSGILTGLSFQTLLFGWHFPNLGFLAWIAIVPLIWIIYDAKVSQSFAFGFVSAVVCNVVNFHWLYTALHTYGHISPLPSFLTMFLLALFLALYVGAVCALARWFVIKTKIPLLLWLPVLWVLADWARNVTPFGGYPWVHLGATQVSYLPLVQIAGIAGSYGIIFCIVWFNVWLTEALFKIQKKESVLFVPKTIVTALIAILVLGYGFYHLHQTRNLSAKAPHMKVGLLQPNIPQDEKWDETTLTRQKNIFKGLVESLEKTVDLIIWPEAAWTESTSLDATRFNAEDLGLSTARGKTPYTLLGLVFSGIENNNQRLYNSAALLDAQGNILEKYHKAHLVPFGEYVPLRNLLFFLQPVAAIGDFEAGKGYFPLQLEQFKIAPLICFEDIFPEISRTMVRHGANLLVNISNDAWYGLSSAPWQHLAHAALRSVETGRAMVRATNTGVTAVIEPTGKVAIASALFEKGVIVYQVPLLTGQTVYTKLGDWFVLACAIFTLWQLLNLLFKKKSGNI
ncbi:MAG: apolipoprotein N-acyltransferase [Deltaproteobacteria bacterium]|nr:apolipoprotein N-acyltransferase [Deltaproteobacteria bacterium]